MTSNGSTRSRLLVSYVPPATLLRAPHPRARVYRSPQGRISLGSTVAHAAGRHRGRFFRRDGDGNSSSSGSAGDTAARGRSRRMPVRMIMHRPSGGPRGHRRVVSDPSSYRVVIRGGGQDSRSLHRREDQGGGALEQARDELNDAKQQSEDAHKNLDRHAELLRSKRWIRIWENQQRGRPFEPDVHSASDQAHHQQLEETCRAKDKALIAARNKVHFLQG